ncbi:sorting nexin-24 isoform X5 [Caretta caretta]|uniref:sorting nexin-24 isoform X5 n=1 Tax=Caretta caretta TaxID=8467 RepID=UPI0020948A31|nr:sorting nexin-24 isoform X6 [Caretta caretta]
MWAPRASRDALAAGSVPGSCCCPGALRCPARPARAMELYIPSFRYEESELERGYTLKRFIRTPEIPSKHVRNWVPKVLEQRRQGLEIYLQSDKTPHQIKTIILENEDLPKIFLDFLNVRHVPSLPKAESYGSFDETESEESSKLSHQPVLLFLRDPYVLPTANDDFPNVVIEGVLHGIFYPHLLPR